MRILHAVGRMGNGGVEAMIMNLYRYIDRNKIQFDFAVHTREPQIYDEEIGSLGGYIYRFPRFNGKNFTTYIRAWEKFFEEHEEHGIIHGHIGSTAAIYLKIAKNHGRYAIAHSHSTKSTVNRFRTLCWSMMSYPTRYVADYFFACSAQAAVSRFGEKVAHSDRCRVLPNAIDTRRFAYDEGDRRDVRRELGLENAFVIGHVGRHTPQKNPMFLIEIFAAVYGRDHNARLLQVGGGEMTDRMKQRCAELGVSDAVVFAGMHGDVERYYSAMDVFLFPSRWEGLGNVLVEAQTNGLNCVVADTVPEEADMRAGLFHALSLDETAEQWADTVCGYKGCKRMKDAVSFVKKAGFDICDTSKQLQEFYMSCV